MVVDQHPTLLNVTLHPSKVGVTENIQLHLWQPPWLDVIKQNEEIVEITGEGERGDRVPHVIFRAFNSSQRIFSTRIIELAFICIIKYAWL